MLRPSLLALLFPAVFCAAWPASSAAGVSLQRFEFDRPQMGVPFRIILYAPARAEAAAAAEAAFARVAELNAIMSDYDTDSELSRLSQSAGQGRPVRVSADLWQVLQRAGELARETSGAFDVTCGPAVSLWRKARRDKKMPDPAKLAETQRRVGYEKLRMDPARRTVELLVPYMRLDLGAIAKGYAADEALKVLRTNGIRSALVSGGGDMAAGDAPPGRPGWRVGLPMPEAPDAAPTEFVLLKNRALATSGDMFQHVEIDGVRYSHIVDPRTGIGLTNQSLVIVIARDGMTADSLSTAASVLGPEKGVAFIEQAGECVRVLRAHGKSIEQHESSCFRRFLDSRESGAVPGPGPVPAAIPSSF